MVSFHVEATSKCTLECPLCDRTWFYEKFAKRNLHEIYIDKLVKFVGPNSKITLCGNNGDPIYHSRFLELCTKLKDNNCKIYIYTNGSAKTKEWWQKLNNILDKDDLIYFSIDGLEDTNHIYRKNSKWKSIMTAIEVMKERRCSTVWKYIVFKHNQHQIEEARELSKQWGFDQFQLEQSDRWLDKKDLMPDEQYIDAHYQHQEKVLENKEYKTKMNPSCLVDDEPQHNLYVDSEGYFYPCCWIATHRFKQKSLFAPNKLKMNVVTHTLDQILDNKLVKDFFNKTKDFDSAHECCKIKCGVKNG